MVLILWFGRETCNIVLIVRSGIYAELSPLVYIIIDSYLQYIKHQLIFAVRNTEHHPCVWDYSPSAFREEAYQVGDAWQKTGEFSLGFKALRK